MEGGGGGGQEGGVLHSSATVDLLTTARSIRTCWLVMIEYESNLWYITRKR